MADRISYASCVMSDDYDRILLVHVTSDDVSQWQLPGGQVNPGEAPESAAVRMCNQLLGVNVRLLQTLGQAVPEDENIEYVYHWFQAQIIGGEPNLSDTATFDDFDYFELDDMMGLSLSDEVLTLLPKIVDGEVALDRDYTV